MPASPPLVLADSTVAGELTLIIPLGLLIVTLAWWAWMSYRGRRPH
jgi:hypothetical protein